MTILSNKNTGIVN